MEGLAQAAAARVSAARLRALAASALGCLALGLLAAAPAAAAPTWLAPVDLSAPGQSALGPQVAVDPQGNATAVWWRYDGADFIVQSAERPAGGAWSEPVDLSVAGEEATGPGVAVDPQGNATAVWQRSDGAKKRVQASERPPGGAWSEPLDLSAAGEDAEEPQLAVDPQGRAIVVWGRFDGANLIVQSSERPPGGAWSEPVDLSAAGQNGLEPEVAVDPQGNATAVWWRSDGSHSRVQAAERPAGGAWSEPVDLSAAGQDAEIPQVAVDPQGKATAVWQRTDGSNRIAQAAQRLAGGAWSAPDDLSAEGQNAFNPQVAVDPQGNATAVWGRSNGSHFIAQAAERPPGGAWSGPVDLSAPGQDAEEPQVAVDPLGNAIVVWWRSDGSHFRVQAAERPAGGAWGAPEDLSAAGQDAEVPRLAVDTQGNAVAAWERSNGANPIQAAGYDAAGPQLRDLSIPPSGIARQPVHFSVSPFDVWSPLAATSWSFGDGAAAVGTAVSHRYARAGRYPVGVTGTDAVGNATSASGAIAIAPRSVAFAARIARVKRGRALLRLRCRGGGRCRGVVRLIARGGVRRVVERNGRRRVVRRTKRVLIGWARFAIPAGRTKVIRVRLNRRGRALLRRARRHRLKVRLTGRDVRHRTVVLKEMRRKRRRSRGAAR